MCRESGQMSNDDFLIQPSQTFRSTAYACKQTTGHWRIVSEHTLCRHLLIDRLLPHRKRCTHALLSIGGANLSSTHSRSSFRHHSDCASGVKLDIDAASSILVYFYRLEMKKRPAASTPMTYVRFYTEQHR